MITIIIKYNTIFKSPFKFCWKMNKNIIYKLYNYQKDVDLNEWNLKERSGWAESDPVNLRKTFGGLRSRAARKGPLLWEYDQEEWKDTHRGKSSCRENTRRKHRT